MRDCMLFYAGSVPAFFFRFFSAAICGGDCSGDTLESSPLEVKLVAL